jgi:hypothetical protein
LFASFVKERRKFSINEKSNPLSSTKTAIGIECTNFDRTSSAYMFDRL